MLINMSVVRVDGDTQVRVKIDESVVTEYSQMMIDGVLFDPIVVFNDGRYLWLADGFHRFLAAEKLKLTQIEATVKMGGVEDAKLYAFAANSHRGESLTHQDIKKIVLMMETHPVCKKWTVKQVAKHIGKSEATIYRAKRHTRSYPAALPKPLEPAKEPTPEPPSDEIKELTDTINALAEENETLKDQVLIAAAGLEDFEKSDVEKMMNHLRKRIADLELEVRIITESRNFMQEKNAELVRTVKNLKYKLARLQNAPDRLGKVT